MLELGQHQACKCVVVSVCKCSGWSCTRWDSMTPIQLTLNEYLSHPWPWHGRATVPALLRRGGSSHRRKITVRGTKHSHGDRGKWNRCIKKVYKETGQGVEGRLPGGGSIFKKCHRWEVEYWQRETLEGRQVFIPVRIWGLVEVKGLGRHFPFIFPLLPSRWELSSSWI